MKQLAFFDVDGTLSVPVYHDGDREVIGFTDEGWLEYCRVNGAEAYCYCKTVEPVRRYAAQLQARGVELYVLTSSQSEKETQAKVRFVERNYPGLFREVLAVRHDKDKLDVILQKAAERGTVPEQCELVEDTYGTLLLVMQQGIRPTHISAIVCDL